MKNLFKSGDKKYFSKVVEENDTATFDSGQVHPVYATFALGRDAEWACRLFVLDMKENNEEGIGTYLNIIHESPAVLGSTVVIESCLKKIEGNSVICSFEAKVGERLIARGETGQKILKAENLEKIFSSIV